jgi:hypothetical protein
MPQTSPLGSRATPANEGSAPGANLPGSLRRIDEFELHIVPTLLGDGERLLEKVGDVKLQQMRVIEAPGVAHIEYRVVK